MDFDQPTEYLIESDGDSTNSISCDEDDYCYWSSVERRRWICALTAVLLILICLLVGLLMLLLVDSDQAVTVRNHHSLFERAFQGLDQAAPFDDAGGGHDDILRWKMINTSIGDLNLQVDRQLWIPALESGTTETKQLSLKAEPPKWDIRQCLVRRASGCLPGQNFYGGGRRLTALVPMVEKRRIALDFLAAHRVVFGIPSVNRKRNYLFQTVTLLIRACDPEELPHLKILILDGDLRRGLNPDIARIHRVHSSLIKSGQIRFLHLPDMYYRLTRPLQQFYDDPPDRVFWRSKQALDFAYLMEFGMDMGEFYVQLEDDIRPINNYLTEMAWWVNEHFINNQDWIMLSLYTADPSDDHAVSPPGVFYGFLGQLFRASALPDIIRYFRDHFAEAPVDWLMRDYTVLKQKQGQGYRHIYAHNPPIFQHLGKVSSLAMKRQDIVANHFVELQELYDHPPPQSWPPFDVRKATAVEFYKSNQLVFVMAEDCYSSPGESHVSTAKSLIESLIKDVLFDHVQLVLQGCPGVTTSNSTNWTAKYRNVGNINVISSTDDAPELEEPEPVEQELAVEEFAPINGLDAITIQPLSMHKEVYEQEPIATENYHEESQMTEPVAKMNERYEKDCFIALATAASMYPKSLGLIQLSADMELADPETTLANIGWWISTLRKRRDDWVVLSLVNDIKVEDGHVYPAPLFTANLDGQLIRRKNALPTLLKALDGKSPRSTCRNCAQWLINAKRPAIAMNQQPFKYPKHIVDQQVAAHKEPRAPMPMPPVQI